MQIMFSTCTLALVFIYHLIDKVTMTLKRREYKNVFLSYLISILIEIKQEFLYFRVKGLCHNAVCKGMFYSVRIISFK